MESYDRLLVDISEWFRKIQAAHGREMRCHSGCSRCCHGLFVISLADAVHVTAAVGALPDGTRREAIARAGEIQDRIKDDAPDLRAPYLLAPSDEPLVELVAAHNGGARCALLGINDECLIYPKRPLACRLEGLPMVDQQDGLFGDWCEYNFTDGVGLNAEEDLQWDYYRLQEIERAVTARLAQAIAGAPGEYCTVLIPSLLVEYERFWAPLLVKLGGPPLDS